MIDFSCGEYELLESWAAEYEYSVSHGDTWNAVACLRNIKKYLSGMIRRYSKTFSEKELTEILKEACISYGKLRPDKPFVDVYLEHLNGYARSQGFKLKQDKDTAHLAEIQAMGYRGNGIHSFENRYFVGQPENIAVRYLGDRGRTSLFNALSDDPDHTQHDNALSGTQDGTQGNSALMDGQGLEDASGEPEEQLDDVGMDGLDSQTDDEISALIDSILGLD